MPTARAQLHHIQQATENRCSTEEVNMQRIHFKPTSAVTLSLRRHNIEAFCCFSKANLLVSTFFSPIAHKAIKCIPNGKGEEADGGGIDGKIWNSKRSVSDLKLVYVCSQYRKPSSLNCRAFFSFYDSQAKQATPNHMDSTKKSCIHGIMWCMLIKCVHATFFSI